LHVAALKALRSGDGAAAASAIRADIESARDDVCRLLTDRATTGRVNGKAAAVRR
jgi:DNA-binding GntR family transcriptional regulator